MLNKTLFLEIDKPNYVPIYTVQYDYNSRFYEITILNNSQPLDLTGIRVIVAGKKPDGKEVFNSCKVLDAKKGLIQLELTEQMNAVNGASEYALELFSADGMLSSQPFKLIVTRSTISKSVESSKELGALKDALNEVQDIDNRFAQTNAQLSEKVGKNEISINIKYPPAPLVAVVNGAGADNTSAIQSMIDYVGNNGGGEIIIPVGTYFVSTLMLRDRVTLVGTGRYSIIKSIDNNNAIAIVQMYGKSALNTCIKNLSIDGNKDNQTNVVDGILIDCSLAKNDTHHLVENVYIHSCSGNGLSIPTQSRENRFINIWSEKNKLNGFYICGTDNFMAFCTANFNSQNGYYFLNSNSNKINTSKAFGNDEHGFKVENCGNLQLTSLESQENRKHGYYFLNSFNNTGCSLVSDTNSTEGTKSYHAIVLENCLRHDLSGVVTNVYNLLNEGHGYAVALKGDSKFNYLRFLKYGNQKPMKNYYDEIRDVSNAIFINNFDFSLMNLQKYSMVESEKQANISDCFDSIVIHPTAITGQYSISYQYQSQKLEIMSSNQAGNWASIYGLKKIEIYENQSLSVLCELSLSNELGTNCRLSVDWLDDGNIKIGEDSVYGNSQVSVNAKAPIGTRSANIKISFYPKEVGEIGSMYINSFKFGKY